LALLNRFNCYTYEDMMPAIYGSFYDLEKAKKGPPKSKTKT